MSKRVDINIIKELRQILPEGEVLSDEPMSKHTTFRIGGPADLFIRPKNVQEIRDALSFLEKAGIPVFVLGNGSNLLVSDQGFRGVVLQLFRNFQALSADGKCLKAQSGLLLSALASEAAKRSLTGLEFASGIPGTVGGGILMNAGAYGGEICDVLQEAVILTKENELRTIRKDELGLSYRRSRAMDEEWVILEGTFELSEGSPEAITARMEEMREARTSKQPLEYPSAGSTFKRPEGYFAGKLIMDAGLAGESCGGACVSEKHCGFVINRGGATAEDVVTLIRRVQEIVRKNSGVQLETEVRFLGFDTDV